MGLHRVVRTINPLPAVNPLKEIDWIFQFDTRSVNEIDGRTMFSIESVKTKRKAIKSLISIAEFRVVCGRYIPDDLPVSKYQWIRAIEILIERGHLIVYTN